MLDGPELSTNSDLELDYLAQASKGGSTVAETGHNLDGEELRYLTPENRDKLAAYFDPGETCITTYQLKKRRTRRAFYAQLCVAVDKIKSSVRSPLEEEEFMSHT